MSEKYKITAFASRPDERVSFDLFEEKLNLDIKHVSSQLSLDVVEQAKGSVGVTVLGNCDCSKPVLEELSKMGIKFLASRSAGYNNIDVEAAKSLGIQISNAQYSPNCVADFAIMLALMLNRKVVTVLKRNVANDFSLPGVQGHEMKNMTVGVIGTGRIGQAVIKNYSGFGCKILGYDLYENEEMKNYITYVDLDYLLENSDIITLHTPLFDSTYHMINKDSIAKMKKGVKIINTARGELIDTDALIEGLKSRHIGAAGLDVLESEKGIFHTDCRMKGMYNEQIAILKAFDNVVLTNHVAFYTDQAVEDMVYCGLNSLYQFITTGTADFEIK
ncbi:MAG: D-isomer specific 2-hydroxyacid dehydrogenase family protein [Sphaerochaetaceae bacterium]|nr:D-isomer specific 2-hydroxyacid dehydrogenase family protein [Sphaerochaetaceae bacterium]MDC7238184.1 D-isomer specific 2-hydroxyacid dehydrogenase family protein [Sphaerochaetaceae bacterium]